MRPRVVVVGAGSAGCVLASRLADRYDVTVLEAGRWANSTTAASEVNGSPSATEAGMWRLPTRLTRDRAWTATPGRVVGGSSVVNGGYFAAPAQLDLDRWRAAGGPAWEPERVRTLIAEAGDRLGAHPAPQTHPIARAFAEASAETGVAEGLLPLLTTVVDGMPRNVAHAYLPDSGVTVRSDCRVLSIVTDDGRAIGVDVADAIGGREVIDADDVVLCAGGFGTPRLLLASGLGPADLILRSGIDPVVDLPGVGALFSDHATVWVEFLPTVALLERQPGPELAHGAFPIALRLGADGTPGDALEILACTQPPDPSAAARGDDTRFGVIVGLQRPRSRGTVTPTSAHPLAPSRIAYGYLQDPDDRAALRQGVRSAASLLCSAPFSALVKRLVDLDHVVLTDDDRLDEWIAQRLGSASHTCGSAPMGPDTDPSAVTDGAGRVRGIAGLRVADTSLLPVVPSRSPAATAMAVGAIIADQM